jgi:hypothetical protein
VVVVIYLHVVALCSRNLRCVVNSWYHRVVASRSLLLQIVGHYFRRLITTLTHGHRWQLDVANIVGGVGEGLGTRGRVRVLEIDDGGGVERSCEGEMLYLCVECERPNFSDMSTMRCVARRASRCAAIIVRRSREESWGWVNESGRYAGAYMMSLRWSGETLESRHVPGASILNT